MAAKTIVQRMNEAVEEYQRLRAMTVAELTRHFKGQCTPIREALDARVAASPNTIWIEPDFSVVLPDTTIGTCSYRASALRYAEEAAKEFPGAEIVDLTQESQQ